MIERWLRRISKYLFAGVDRFVPSPTGPRILIYHQVGTFEGRQMEVTEEDFAYQLDWLDEHREVVDLGTALSQWDKPGSERLAVLTFDDGYADTFTSAFPLLVEKGMPFMIYVASRQVEDQDLGGGNGGSQALRWDQLEAMLESGLLTLGAHTHSHPDLRTIQASEIEYELSTCDELIERRTGVRPRHFAYPWGYWSTAADNIVRERYESAVLGGSPLTYRPLDRFRVPRFPVQLSDGSRFFRSRLTGGLLVEERLRRRLRGYRGP